MKLLPSLFFFLSLMGVARANLGEKPDEFRSHFGTGDPVVDMGDTSPDNGLRQQRFTVGGLQVEVLFNYISVGESYFPSTPLSEKQIQALLDANSEGFRWDELPKGTHRSWIRQDGAEARLTDSSFIFRSKELVAKEQAWNNSHSPGVNTSI